MFFTEVKARPQQGLVTHGQRIWTFGSCFADEIGGRLADGLFDIRVNPCGTLYNPASIANALMRIIDGHTYTAADLFEHNGLWHCMDFHSEFSNEKAEAVLQRINATVTALHHELPSLRLLMVTFGSAHIFIDRANSRVAGNCHKLPAKRFDERNLTVDEITDEFSAVVKALRQAAPEVQLLFTVSPIRHKAYGFHADRLSKATLLLATEALCRRHEATYFPAYEIMNDELRDYRFYAADMVHPSPVACDHIYSRFADAYFTPATAAMATEGHRLAKRMQHRHTTASAAQQKAFRAETIAFATTLKSKYPAMAAAIDRITAPTAD